MQYSPKLKQAMEEIKDIIKKNDIGAFVVLHDESQKSEFFSKLDPSYSCAKIEQNSVRFKLKKSELTEEEFYRIGNATFNLLVHLADVVSIHANQFQAMREMLKKELGGSEGNGGFSSHEEQFN